MYVPHLLYALAWLLASAGFKSCERDIICGRRNQTGWTVTRGQTQGGTRCWSCLVGEVERVPGQAGRLRGEKGGSSLDWLARENIWIIEQPFNDCNRHLRWFGDLCCNWPSPCLGVVLIVATLLIQSLERFKSGTWTNGESSLS